MKHILVTGGFGFLGSHLVERLLQAPDHHVHVVDDLRSSPLPLPHLLGELAGPGELTYDVRSVARFAERRQIQRFEEIYHLASVVGPAGVLPHAGTIASQIVEDTRHVTELALRWGARLVDVSTSEVYGGGKNGVCREDYPKIVSQEPSARLEYAAAKLAAEIAIQNAARTRQLDAVIVRPFNIAGPRQSAVGGFVLPRFVGQALTGAPLTVFGDGTQRRALTHVRDVAEGLIAAMEQGRPGESYNVGGIRNATTIGDLAREVVRAAGSRSAIETIDPREVYGPHYAEAPDKIPDDTKSRTELRFEPTRALSEVVNETVLYMRALPRPLFARLAGFTPTSSSTTTAPLRLVAAPVVDDPGLSDPELRTGT